MEQLDINFEGRDLRNLAYDKVRHQIWSQVWSQVRYQIWDQVGDQVWYQVRQELLWDR